MGQVLTELGACKVFREFRSNLERPLQVEKPIQWIIELLKYDMIERIVIHKIVGHEDLQGMIYDLSEAPPDAPEHVKIKGYRVTWPDCTFSEICEIYLQVYWESRVIEAQEMLKESREASEMEGGE